MLKCDTCSFLLAMVRVHKNRAFCDTIPQSGMCKAWIAWAIIVE